MKKKSLQRKWNHKKKSLAFLLSAAVASVDLSVTRIRKNLKPKLILTESKEVLLKDHKKTQVMFKVVIRLNQKIVLHLSKGRSIMKKDQFQVVVNPQKNNLKG